MFDNFIFFSPFDNFFGKVNIVEPKKKKNQMHGTLAPYVRPYVY